MEDEPATEIIEATYRALCEHGYADFTLQDVAAEADRSKGSVHYHYESKEQLFLSVLDFLSDRQVERVSAAGGETPRERLTALFETLLTDDADGHGRELRTAMLEVKAQAPYDATIRDRLAEFDEFLYERLRTILAAGVATGEFDASIDPAATAEFLTTTVTGAHTRQVAVDHAPGRLSETMNRYVETQLLADERAEVAP